ncbi:hypothetical protein QFZ79_000618 [Arthrobacter sp. V4I6]|nr:hypothetical protein [Arthrobacter sp. V1I7]MDQ0852507.1 hypothetical protein [Arthrobacter sp. V4I6]
MPTPSGDSSSIQSGKPSRPIGRRRWPEDRALRAHSAEAVVPQLHNQSPEASEQPRAVLRAFYSALATL